MVPESSTPPLSSFETSEPHTQKQSCTSQNTRMLNYATANPSTLALGFPLAVLSIHDTPSPD